MKTIHVFLAGFGGVGRMLARRIVGARERHAARAGVRLEIAGVADSAGAILGEGGLTDAHLAELDRVKVSTGRLPGAGRPLTPALLTELPAQLVVVDTTATDATVPLLLDAHRRGLGVVLANKLPLAGPQAWFDALCRPRDARVKWETTCGAALPVISTLNTLLDAGDEVRRIEGSLSGTLAYLAAQLEAGVVFGDAVREAKRLGYTEPDPRQDLGGRDAARKALILARMLGWRLELGDVSIESLYPPEMDGLTTDAFLREVDALNEPMRARAAELCAGGRKLRYLARVENGRVALQLTGVDPAGKLGVIGAGDSIVAFTTRDYPDVPMAISGRGAGQDVTASGVLGDIIGVARAL